MPERDDHTLDAANSALDARIATGELGPGDRFADRYAIEALIGRGGMGTVYRVRDTMVDEVVALKLLGVASVDVVERFRREVRLARRITSPHVARTHDLGTHGGIHYLTMELVEGVSLGRKLEDGPLSPARAARVGAAIARGLAAAHAASVVHRDLKPDNVLLEAATGRVVVTDFGIARALESDRTRATGGIAGTPAYMAPEQLTGAPVDGRADLYALGVVLFEMLSGVLPFEGETPISIAVARLHLPPRDLASLRVVPPELGRMVDALLARDRDQRPETAAAVAASLDEIAAAHEHSSSPAAISMPSSASFAKLMTPALHTPSSTSGLRRVIAVPAMTYRGAAEHAHVPDGIADELIDLLTRTRGISAIGRAAMHAEMTREPDARMACRHLGATHLLDGTLQASGNKLRLTTRLTDVATGMQVWTHKEDLEASEGFGLEERAARRVAEGLRIGLEGLIGSERVSAEAMELYTSARKRARSPSVTDRVSTVEALDRVIALAPMFAPALAVHAMACVRAWITPRLPGDPQPTHDWKADALASVARALSHAAHVPETHHAAAMVALQEGRFREVARHARAALALAPAFPDAHLLLGQLKLEAGDAKAGLESIETALDIDPSLHVGWYERARYHGLYGDPVLYESYLEQLKKMQEPVLWAQLEVRVGAWRDDKERIRRGLEVLVKSPHPIAGPISLYARTVLGETPPTAAFDVSSRTFAASPRVRSIALQMQAEALATMGDVAGSTACVESAATTVLVDLDWMDRCPLLAPVRENEQFTAWRRAVALRCEDIWSG